LESISSFIAEDYPEAATRVCRGLYDLSLSLANQPFLGRIAPEFKDPSIRDVVRGNYRIVYLVNEQELSLEILRFWHGARGFLPRRG
jgi:plasmid stabilization system protein ParE